VPNLMYPSRTRGALSVCKISNRARYATVHNPRD
jgi:hypothetical protein